MTRDAAGRGMTRDAAGRGMTREAAGRDSIDVHECRIGTCRAYFLQAQLVTASNKEVFANVNRLFVFINKIGLTYNKRSSNGDIKTA